MVKQKERKEYITMDNQTLKYFKLWNQYYKLQNAINYFSKSTNKDGFEYDVFDYAKEEIVKVEKKINGMKRKMNIK